MSDQAPWEDFQQPAVAPVAIPAPTEQGPWDDFKNPESSVSPAPVPKATTLLEDKNVVVSHPMDMSHDQVNDSIQTGMYGRPRNDFHETAEAPHPSIFNDFHTAAMAAFTNPLLAPLKLASTVSPEDAKAFIPENVKAAVAGTERLGAGVGGLIRWLGDAYKNNDFNPDYLKKVGGYISDAGQSVYDFWHNASQSKKLAPDPEIFRGSFVSNPSWTRATSMVTAQVPALGAATALTIATQNPMAGAEFLGLTGAGEEYESATAKGSSFGRSSLAAGLSGIGNTLLMSLPMGKVLTGFGETGVGSVVRGAAEFEGLNAVMNPFNNIVAKIGGDKTRKLFEGFAESALSMGLSGGLLGGFTAGRGTEIDALVQEAHKAGVPSKDIDAARNAVAKEMSENPEAVTKAINQAKQERMANQMVDEANQIVESNPDHKSGAAMVYNDIKSKLEGVPKPAGISDADWTKQIDASAKLWSARTVTEAQKRGVSVEDVYATTKPTIVGENVPLENEGEQELFQPVNPDKTRSPEFKKWFGDSKVVDEKGEPLVVYHGTTGKFDEFKPGMGNGWSVSRDGFYFTDDISAAKEFGEPIPTYLSAKNMADFRSADDGNGAFQKIVAQMPADVAGGYSDSPGRLQSKGWFQTKEFIDAAQKAGYDGIALLDHLGGPTGKYFDSFIVFDPTQIKSAIGNRGTFDPNNPNILFQGEGGKNPRGSTRFTPEGTVISLMKNADASTFLHESAHVWLKDIHEFIKSGKASDPYKQDWATLKDWLGVEKNKDDLTVAQHEKFAQGFEKYLREGVSPTPELNTVFGRLKEWLRNVYQSAKTLKVDLSDDVRGVMDRMLAAPEAPVEGQYVKNQQYDIKWLGTDKATAKDIREQFSGMKNEQIVRGNQLANEIRKSVPEKAEREGMFWYKAANGDIEILSNALDDPKLEKYHGQILRALDLSNKAKAALKKIDQYYKEAGAVSQEVGTIGNVRENYQNRIYLPEPPKDFVKTETKALLKQNTSHAKQRVFDTEFDAASAGKEFATTDVADSLAIHNEEMARVNASRKLADAMEKAGLGAWKRDQPDGWEQVGKLEKRVPVRDENGDAVIGEDGNQVVSSSKFYAPKGIAKGMAAIVDGNFAKKIDSIRNIQKYQGLVKTVDLSFSFFHHFSMVMQTVYQGGVKALLNLPKMQSTLESPEFASIETDFAKHTGMNSMVEANQDILRNLVQKQPDTFGKITNLPGVKQVLQRAEKSSDFLFGHLQRYLKVMDYGQKVFNWVADHPDATNEEVKAAKIGFARHINTVYGGLNWEAMGMTSSNLSLLRIGLLAPDWTISNVQLLTQALGEKGTAGQSSRAHLLGALVGGMVLTEGLNKLLTGHFTDENPSGHKLEVMLSPNVYINMFRGGIGDIVKFGSMVGESGLSGVSRFAQGKLAPFPRTAIGLLTNTQYTGRPIAKKAEGPIANSYDVLKYLLSSLAPMPLGVSNALQYMREPNANSVGGAAVVSGIGRYSKSGGRSSHFKM